MAVQDTLDRIRQPEYTGENRCVPCTAVNVVLAVALALAVQIAVLLADGPPVGAALAGIAVFALAMAAIALRGYLVPGTPWLTKTYFPDWVLRRFDKAPADSPVQSTDGDADETLEGNEIESVLSRMGAVEPCDDVEDLCLTDEFRTGWREEVSALRNGDAMDLSADLAPVLEVDAAEIAVEEHGSAWSARVDGRRVGQWESRAAVLADVAAATDLRARDPDTWKSLSVVQRGQLLQGLRVFIEQCPVCDGVVALDERTVESCCRSVDVVAVTCRDCDARVFEAEKPEM